MLGIHWDCDGTIMDTERLYAKSYRQALIARPWPGAETSRQPEKA